MRLHVCVRVYVCVFYVELVLVWSAATFAHRLIADTCQSAATNAGRPRLQISARFFARTRILSNGRHVCQTSAALTRVIDCRSLSSLTDCVLDSVFQNSQHETVLAFTASLISLSIEFGRYTVRVS